MKKSKTTEYYSNEINELTKGGFKLESEYKNKETKVNIRCLSCNEIFNTSAGQFLQELKCKNCGIKIDLFDRYNLHSIEDYKKHIYDKCDDFEILSDILDKNGNIKVIHKQCGIEQYAVSKKFIHNQICKNCDGGQPVDYYGFSKRVAEIYNTEYVVIGRFKNDFEFIHTKCKTRFKMDSGMFLKNNSPCPICNKNTKWDLKRVKDEIHNKTNGEFTCVDTEYKTVDTNIKIKHNICNEVFNLSVNAFLKCPKCRICENSFTLGEKYVKDAVLKLGFKFIKEYSYEDCKRYNTLRFDFAVFDKDDNFICLIEYDGEEHYIPLFAGNSIDLLKDMQERDNIKNTYCINNNINLIRIPFWEIENIETIIKGNFKKNKIIIDKMVKNEKKAR